MSPLIFSAEIHREMMRYVLEGYGSSAYGLYVKFSFGLDTSYHKEMQCMNELLVAK